MEVVFQVPKENLEEALKYIKKEMENPFKGKVETLVDLTVSMDTGKNYFEAK